MKEIETNSKQFQNVLAKAIETKPLVKIGAKPNQYFVAGSSGDNYVVHFQRGSGGKMLGGCMCQGAMRGFHCYHLAAALVVHSAFVRAGLRQPAAGAKCRRTRGAVLTKCGRLSETERNQNAGVKHRPRPKGCWQQTTRTDNDNGREERAAAKAAKTTRAVAHEKHHPLLMGLIQRLISTNRIGEQTNDEHHKLQNHAETINRNRITSRTGKLHFESGRFARLGRFADSLPSDLRCAGRFENHS